MQNQTKNTIQINGIMVVYIHLIYLLFPLRLHQLVLSIIFSSYLMRQKVYNWINIIYNFMKIMRRRLVLLMECQVKNGFKPNLHDYISSSNFLYWCCVCVWRNKLTINRISTFHCNKGQPFHLNTFRSTYKITLHS